MDEDDAAVTVPSVAKAGLRLGIFSMFTVRGPSSDSTIHARLLDTVFI